MTVIKMKNLQFWHTIVDYNGYSLNTYYLAENKTWLFAAKDIFQLIEKFLKNPHESLDSKYTTTKLSPQNQIRIFENDIWETIDVLHKNDILEITKSINLIEFRIFEKWIETICLQIPEACVLPKDSKEYEFLNLATNRFLDIYEEINGCSFMKLPPEARLYKLKDFFCVYTELLLYPPIKEHISFVEKTRPPMESVISGEFIKFIRNILAHFPFFTTWDEIYVSKQLVNWSSEGRSIDRFLNKYQGHGDVEYRFKEKGSGKWRYPSIKFPQIYNDDKIYLKDMVSEEDGILLCAVLMFNVVSSQIIFQH